MCFRRASLVVHGLLQTTHVTPGWSTWLASMWTARFCLVLEVCKQSMHWNSFALCVMILEWINKSISSHPEMRLYLGWFLETCFLRDSLVGHILSQYWHERVKLVTCFASIWTDIAYLSRDVWLHSVQAYPEDPPPLDKQIILFCISSSNDPTCPIMPWDDLNGIVF